MSYGNPTELTIELVQGDDPYASCIGVDTDLIGLYPNPTTGIVYLEVNDGRESKVKVFNMYGQVVRIVEADEKTIDMRDLPSGMYVIKKGTSTVKLIKQ